MTLITTWARASETSCLRASHSPRESAPRSAVVSTYNCTDSCLHVLAISWLMSFLNNNIAFNYVINIGDHSELPDDKSGHELLAIRWVDWTQTDLAKMLLITVCHYSLLNSIGFALRCQIIQNVMSTACRPYWFVDLWFLLTYCSDTSFCWVYAFTDLTWEFLSKLFQFSNQTQVFLCIFGLFDWTSLVASYWLGRQLRWIFHQVNNSV